MVKEPEQRLTNQTDRDIAAFFWKEDETLLFLRDFGGDENFHFFRISSKGENEKDLTPYEDTKVQLISNLENISENHIIIGTNQRDKRVFDAYRLNVKTGETKNGSKKSRSLLQAGWWIIMENCVLLNLLMEPILLFTIVKRSRKNLKRFLRLILKIQ